MTLLWALIAFYAGYVYSLHKNRKPPIITFTIDPKVLHEINTQMVSSWLHKKGLTWMPKGAEFMYQERKDESRRG